MSKRSTYTAQLYQSISARAQADLIFADFDHEVLTYRQLLKGSNRLASLFRNFKLQQGERIIILSNHDQHTISIFVAALLDGLTPIIVSSDTKSHRLKAVVEKVTPKLIFIDENIRQSLSWLQDLPCISVLAKTSDSIESPARLFKSFGRRALPYPDILSTFRGKKPRCTARPEDIALIIFTSGTTSTPKGILITHINLFEHLKTITRIFKYGENQKIFNNMALAHADGLVQGPLLALYSGAQLFRPDRFSIQNLEKLLTRVRSKKVTHLITVPTILSLIDRFLKRDDYFSEKGFTNLISVAAKIDPNLWRRLQNRFNIRICNIYGLTETVAGGLFCGPDDETFSIGSVGKPIDMEARIVNRQGQDCAPGIQGELWLRGINVIPGYLEEPDATASLFSDTWLRTGDLSLRDQNGFFHIVGRIKSVIVSGGYNIHPDEVNEALLLHPDVIDAATVGISDKDWGELVASVVESDVMIDEDILINHCRMHLESIKVPKKIIQIRKLPRGISGKVKLKKLKMVLEDGEKECTLALVPDISEIISIASTVFNIDSEHIAEESLPEEIPGWDSLGHLSLIAAVEKKFGVEFDVENIMRVNSLQSLHDILSSLFLAPLETKNNKSMRSSRLSETEYKTMQRIIASSNIGEKKEGSLMLAVNPAGIKKPWYWCFNALEYELGTFSAYLDPGQPLWGLYSGGGVLDKSISPDRLAEHYVNEILEDSPDGTFIIGGNCRGAAIVWKMVQLLEEKDIMVEKVCLLELFSPDMYQGIEGDLMLIFGEQSPFAYPQQFNWQKPGWEKIFKKTPLVHMTPGTHGDFFNPGNAEPLVERISRFFSDQA